jgi:hypothetical protein
MRRPTYPEHIKVLSKGLICVCGQSCMNRDAEQFISRHLLHGNQTQTKNEF